MGKELESPLHEQMAQSVDSDTREPQQSARFGEKRI